MAAPEMKTPPASLVAFDLLRRENYLRAHRALHAAWSYHVGRDPYAKGLFLELEQALTALALAGLGRELEPGEEPDPIGGAVVAGPRHRG